MQLAGLPASQRDGRLRAAISGLIRTAREHGCAAIAVEDLHFTDAREQGREWHGSRPSRGKRGRGYRRMLAGIPTGKFRDRLAQMASNAGLAVIAVDPAYTSRWGAEHWLAPLRDQHTVTTGHHAAAVVIGRRAHGHAARRREGVTSGGQRTARRRAAPTAPAARARTGTAGPARPSGSHPGGARPRRPTGHARPTRQPTTVRGRPLSSAHHRSVSRNGDSEHHLRSQVPAEGVAPVTSTREGSTTYTALCEREGRWWVITVPELPGRRGYAGPDP